MYYFESPIVMVIILISSLIVGATQMGVKSAYAKYSKQSNFKAMSGKEVAEMMLRSNGINDVTITRVNGELSDHYNPRTKTVGLSPAIYDGQSIASMAVAAHEVGHAIQHSEGYIGIKARDAILPICNISSKFGYVAIVIGLMGNVLPLLWVGIFSLFAVLAFQVVTLPVEFNASKRAIDYLNTSMNISEEVSNGSKAMLNAAALTYVAAVMATLLNIIQLMIRANDRNRRR